VGFTRLTNKGHASFLGGAVTFFNVAAHTGSHHILPTVTAASGPRNNVIKGKTVTIVTTVLAGMIVPLQKIATGEGNVFVGDTNVVTETNHSGQGKIGVEEFAVVLYLLSLALNNEHSSSSPARNIQRFIGSIKH